MTGTETKALRQLLGLETYAMADMLGVNVSTIYRWEARRGKEVFMDPLQAKIMERIKASAETCSGKKLQDIGRKVRVSLVANGSLPALGTLLKLLFD